MTLRGAPQLYLALFGLGVIVPNIAFIPWLLQHGFAPALFLEQAFASRIAAFFTLDVVASAVTVLVVGALNLPRREILLVALACFAIGVSAALPLLFYFLASAQPAQTAAPKPGL